MEFSKAVDLFKRLEDALGLNYHVGFIRFLAIPLQCISKKSEKDAHTDLQNFQPHQNGWFDSLGSASLPDSPSNINSQTTCMNFRSIFVPLSIEYGLPLHEPRLVEWILRGVQEYSLVEKLQLEPELHGKRVYESLSRFVAFVSPFLDHNDPLQSLLSCNPKKLNNSLFDPSPRASPISAANSPQHSPKPTRSLSKLMRADLEIEARASVSSSHPKLFASTLPLNENPKSLSNDQPSDSPGPNRRGSELFLDTPVIFSYPPAPLPVVPVLFDGSTIRPLYEGLQ